MLLGCSLALDAEGPGREGHRKQQPLPDGLQAPGAVPGLYLAHRPIN